MKNNKLFAWVVAISALLVSVSAAYYSIFGLGKMFAGASTNVMIMAGSLEISKLVIASLLYNYWKTLNKILRTYLSVACGILIMITSAGIYGFLSAAYQETANKVEIIDKKSGTLEKERVIIGSEIKRYESQISQKDTRIASLNDLKIKQQGTMDNLISKNQSVKGVRGQMTSIDAEISKLDLEVKALNDSLAVRNEKLKSLDLKTLDLETNQDVAGEIGPLKYMSKLTGKSLDQVVNYFIIALMLVFDPLAIALVIASNFIFASLKSNKTAVTSSQEGEMKEEKEEEITDEEIEENFTDDEDYCWELDIPLEELSKRAEESEESSSGDESGNNTDPFNPNSVYIDPTKLK